MGACDFFYLRSCYAASYDHWLCRRQIHGLSSDWSAAASTPGVVHACLTRSAALATREAVPVVLERPRRDMSPAAQPKAAGLCVNAMRRCVDNEGWWVPRVDAGQ